MVAGDGPLPGHDEIMNTLGQRLRGRSGTIRVTVERVPRVINNAFIEAMSPREPPNDQNNNEPRPQ